MKSNTWKEGGQLSGLSSFVRNSLQKRGQVQ